MKHLVLALALVGTMALPAHPQNALGPDPGPGAVTCGDFTALDTVEQRLAMLSGIQPFGDDMEPSDQNASEQWAATVTAACADHPDRPLADAAQEAMGP
jgi:hypothetical protein